MSVSATVLVALVAAAVTVSDVGEGDARVATLARAGGVSIGCMRSTSGVCYILVKTAKGMDRLAVKGGTVGRLVYAPPILLAVGVRPPDPAHCVFHKVLEGEQTVSGS